MTPIPGKSFKVIFPFTTSTPLKRSLEISKLPSRSAKSTNGGTVKPAEGEEAVKLSQRAYAKPDDIEAYKKLKAAGTKLYAQYVPADAEVSIDEFLK